MVLQDARAIPKSKSTHNFFMKPKLHASTRFAILKMHKTGHTLQFFKILLHPRHFIDRPAARPITGHLTVKGR